jgi:uncharacterized protein (DUF4415 family)
MPKNKLDFSNVSTSNKQSVDPDDAPELTDELLEKFAETAEVRRGEKVVRRGRPPLGNEAKGVVTMRLDADVLESYRALGTGWQTRLNADLRRVRKLGIKVKTG